MTQPTEPGLVVTLKRGREKSVRQGHPWVFSGAVDRVEGDEGAPLARLVTASGEELGVGFWSPRSQIRLRLLAGSGASSPFPRAPSGTIDRSFFAARLDEALSLRRTVVPAETTGYRVVNAEGDGIPGWTVDRYGRVLVSQITAAGLEALREEAYAALAGAFSDVPDLAIVQTNDLPARRSEGLATGGLEAVVGEPPEEASFVERGLALSAELVGGQKTGFYLDQRENRARAERYAAGRTVLDLFAHTGAFSLAALRAGATRAVLVESAPRLAERGAAALGAHGIETDRFEWVVADVFEELRRRQRGTAERFDLVIADPPPLVRRKSDLDRGARAYKDLNRLALDRTATGGLLLTFTCSGAVDAKLFRQILFAAAMEAGVRLSLLEPLAAAPDHPVAVTHPQGEYLHGWLARVVGR